MNSYPNPRVLLIMGSVRAERHCPQIADWFLDIARQVGGLSYEIIDLKDWHLPADDEPKIPATGNYLQPHTRAWSEKVSGADGVIILSPQYNWGYPAVLKNALDHLYNEWRGKPLVIATYGGHGGSKCAEQLRQVADGFKMRTVATMPALKLTHDVIHGAAFDARKEFTGFEDSIRQAVEELKAAFPDLS